jgi:hypothetical protein
MRSLVVGGCVCVCAFGACSGGRPVIASDSTLVLELGGTQSSLRRALTGAGVEVAAAKSLRPAADATPAAEANATTDEPGNGRNADAPPPPVDTNSSKPPRARETPPPAPEPFFYVKLGNGQTLIHLARKHLGDGNRFRELLALNGWTEAQSRRLTAGQRVKVPREPGRTSPR